MNVYFKRLHPDAVLPKQSTLYAGGWDIVCTGISHEPNNVVVCHCGFALQLPVGYKMMLQPRSSITKTDWIMQNTPGLCDPDYFGEYRVKFKSLKGNRENFPYAPGDRIAQCYLEKIINTKFIEVDELQQIGNRNPEGYGTTGK